MIRRGLAVLALGATPALADARTTLGVFDQWGAFSESAPQRCFALAEPLRAGGASRWRPFASIASWPGRGVRNQVHIRLSRARNPQARVTLSIGDRRFDLTATAADAWAPDARTDAAIVSAIRASRSMSVETLGHAGGPFADVYTLKGAATAIDAAALACVGG